MTPVEEAIPCEGSDRPLLGRDGHEEQAGVTPRLSRLGQQSKPSNLRSETLQLARLAVPISVSSLLRTFVFSTDASFAGRLGTKFLVGSTFAINWMAILSPLYESPGFVLNTLCSQAIGAGNPKLAGTWLQLTLVAAISIAAPVCLLFLLTDKVTFLSIQDLEVSHLAQTFAYFGIAFIVPRNLYLQLSEMLQAAQIVSPAVWVSVVTVIVNIGFNSLLVDGPWAIGYLGCPLSTLLSSWFNFAAFFLFCFTFKGYHTTYWGGWSTSSFSKDRIRRLLALLVPTAISNFLESSGFVLMSFFVGRIGKTNVAALEVTEILTCALFTFYWGVGASIQVRVGTFLGAGDPVAAKRVLVAAALLTLPLLTFICVGLYIFRRPVVGLFTSDQDVIEVVEGAMLPTLMSFALEVTVLAAINVLEAMGKQQMVPYVVGVAMWGLQLPLAVFCAYRVPEFSDSPVNGIWYGQMPGHLLKSLIFWWLIFKVDWGQMAVDAQVRSEAEQRVALVPDPEVAVPLASPEVVALNLVHQVAATGPCEADHSAGERGHHSDRNEQ